MGGQAPSGAPRSGPPPDGELERGRRRALVRRGGRPPFPRVRGRRMGGLPDVLEQGGAGLRRMGNEPRVYHSVFCKGYCPFRSRVNDRTGLRPLPRRGRQSCCCGDSRSARRRRGLPPALRFRLDHHRGSGIHLVVIARGRRAGGFPAGNWMPPCPAFRRNCPTRSSPFRCGPEEAPPS